MFKSSQNFNSTGCKTTYAPRRQPYDIVQTQQYSHGQKLNTVFPKCAVIIGSQTIWYVAVHAGMVHISQPFLIPVIYDACFLNSFSCLYLCWNAVFMHSWMFGLMLQNFLPTAT